MKKNERTINVNSVSMTLNDLISVLNFAKSTYFSSHKKTKIDSNELGHRIIPLESVGCYVPGGNYPLVAAGLRLRLKELS